MFQKVFLFIVGLVLFSLIGFLLIGIVVPNYNGTVEVTVDAPIEEVYDVVQDTVYMKEWLLTPNMTFKRIETIRGDGFSVGSQHRIYYAYRGNEIVMTKKITAVEPNRRYAFKIEDDFAMFEINLDFQERGQRTLITETTRGGGKNVIARSMVALSRGSIRKHKKEMYDKLKKLIEESQLTPS